MSSDRICDLVQKLTQAVVFKGRSANANDPIIASQREQLTAYSLRILSSHLYPSVQKNDFQLNEAIKSKLNRRNHRVEGLSGPDSALRFEELNQRLGARRNLLTEKWSVMYLLYTLSGAENSHGLSAVDVAREQSFTSAGRGLPVVGAPQRAITAAPGKERAGAEGKAVAVPPVGLLNKTSQALLDQSLACELSEQMILRDIIFNLQGIDGAHVTFNSSADGFVISEKIKVHRPMRVLVRQVCEIGWMYRHVRAYISSTMASPDKGLVEQALCGALENELTDYFRLIAVLESQINQARADTDSNDTGDGSGAGGFSLRRLFVWIAEPLERLRLMAQLTDAAKGLKGGSLASAIESHIRHGDTSVSQFVQRIHSQLCRPLFMMIERWLTVGELQDPFNEFFVSSTQLDDTVGLGVGYDKVWQEQYQLRKAMIPSFITLTLANQILLIGKSINFIRSACEDSKWVSECKIAFHGVLNADGSTTMALLESAINEAATMTHRHLMELITVKYKFRTHCEALKKYLLLGQGDFIQVMLDLLATELDKNIRSTSPTKYMFDRNLTAVLEAAKRASNVQYELPEVAECISVRTMVPTEEDMCGWDVFSLDYIINSPLRVIFTEDAINKYLSVFRFLWQLKRVEHRLTQAWNLHMIMHRRLKNVDGFLRLAHGLRNEMTHFVANVHNVIMFEVLEVSWKELLDEIDQAANLDELIKAHESYINKVVNKALFGGDSDMMGHMKKIFREILAFANSQQRLYDDALSEVDLREQKEREASLMFGNKPLKKDAIKLEKERITIPGDVEAEFKTKVTFASKKYRMLITEFSEALRQVGMGTRSASSPRHGHGTESSQQLANTLGFLTFRLDFNEFYSTARKGERRSSLV